MKNKMRGYGGQRGPWVAICFSVLCAVMVFLAVYSNSNRNVSADEKKPDASKVQIRNNAASLLADLLSKDKELDKILIIKHGAGAAGDLAKAISKEASEGEKEIDNLAKTDTTLNLKTLGLPPGEMAARASDADSERHALLSSSGANFQLQLLLTQTQAMNYGSHLAGVAAANSSTPQQAQEFRSLETALNHLYGQVVATLRVAQGK